MPIKTIAFAIIIPLLSLLVSNTIASAQTTAAVTTAAMTKTYENSQYGFRILYPANWYIAPKIHYIQWNFCIMELTQL